MEAKVFSGAAVGYAKPLKNTQVNDRDLLVFRSPFINKIPETSWGRSYRYVVRRVTIICNVFFGTRSRQTFANIELLPISTTNVSTREEASLTLTMEDPEANTIIWWTVGYIFIINILK
jgi:hypothetical protein